jgi:hypothetical protein
MRFSRQVLLSLATSWVLLLTGCSAFSQDQPQYEANPFVIKLDLPAEDENEGGIVTADVNGDGRFDYLISKPGHVVAYGHDGVKLWGIESNIRCAGNAENRGLPGWAGPAMQAVDIDGDNKIEVLFITYDGILEIHDGATGELERAVEPTKIEGVDKWEHVIVANLRGQGDRDLILQAQPTSGPDSKKGWKRGRLMAAVPAEKPDGPVLWENTEYWGCAHGTARVADLDGDGLDEVLGVTVLNPDGTPVKGWTYSDKWNPKEHGSMHLDSVFVYDVLPEDPGLEVVLLEEGANAISVVGKDKYFWRQDHKRQEPQNAAVGDFDTERPGLEIWCRSRYNEHQKPFVFDAHGNLILQYDLDAVKPENWTVAGVELIWTIDWTGEPKQLAAAKERHTSGDICIFDPMDGRFIKTFPEKADRIYVADVSGDWREEIMVVNGDELHIYHNPAPNPRPDHPRLWEQQNYRRSKMTYNYYSP